MVRDNKHLKPDPSVVLLLEDSTFYRFHSLPKQGHQVPRSPSLWGTFKPAQLCRDSRDFLTITAHHIFKVLFVSFMCIVVRMSDPLELHLQKIVSHHVGAGN